MAPDVSQVGITLGKFYKGGFLSKMSTREASLILGVSASAKEELYKPEEEKSQPEEEKSQPEEEKRRRKASQRKKYYKVIEK